MDTITQSEGQAVTAPASPTTPRNNKAKLRWKELPHAHQYVKRSGWELRPLPPELDVFPEDIVIPEKLKQILKWSLLPGNAWSFEDLRNNGGLAASSPARNKEDVSMIERFTAPSENQYPDQAPSLGADNASVSSYKSSSTHVVTETNTAPPEDDKSPKAKWWTKVGINKPTERVAPAAVKAEPTTFECTSCFEEFPESDMTRLRSCQHWYCRECLGALIATAMSAEASFPPKCCLSPIPLAQILKALDAKQREIYQLKAAEYAVPAAERWYCPNKDCLKWIPSQKLKVNRDLGYDCPHCASKLCRICRGPAHPAKAECPQDFGLEATLETAEVEGWQRCYQCRAVVEHNTGCRHMTCRCRAHFCYVCGKKWQTCSCTETDAANKRAGAQRRRVEQKAKVDAEAAEIARAIAEVEEMERQEAEERRRAEEKRQREEEEQLQVLEALRLEEEAKKIREAEQAERDFRTALVGSFEEEMYHTWRVYRKIQAFQSAALSSRHESEDGKLGAMHLPGEQEAQRAFASLDQTLVRNAEQRRERLRNKQKADLAALHMRQEEEEDDLFVQVQMRMQGKPNKESRTERMLTEIRKQQEEARQEFLENQTKEKERVDQGIAVDNEGLQKWRESRVQRARDKQTAALQKLGFNIGADRQYFELVLLRRSNMLIKHREKSRTYLEAGQDPIGLSEFEASKVQPTLPELDDGEEGPSGIRRGPKLIMTTHGPMALEPFCPQHEAPSSQVQQNTLHKASTADDEISSGQLTPTPMRLSQPHTTMPGSFPSGVAAQGGQPELYMSAGHSPPPCPSSAPPPPPPFHKQSLQSTTLPTTSQQPTTTLVKNSLHPPRGTKPGEIPLQSHNRGHSQNPAPHPLKLDTNLSKAQEQSSLTAFSVMNMASLAAGTAMSLEPSRKSKEESSKRQQDANSMLSSASTLSFASSATAVESTPQLSKEQPDAKSSSTRMTAPSSSSSKTPKRSIWGFKKKEMSQEEMNRRLSAAAGDAYRPGDRFIGHCSAH